MCPEPLPVRVVANYPSWDRTRARRSDRVWIAGAAARQEKILECTEEADEQSLTPREHRQFPTRCLRG